MEQGKEKKQWEKLDIDIFYCDNCGEDTIHNERGNCAVCGK